jgi:hypothetical protein
MRLFFLVLILFLTNYASRADDGRYLDSFSSRNKAFYIKLEGKLWHVRNAKGATLYSLKDSGYATQTILVSDNGERLVIIDDFIYNINIPDGPVLRFYNKGQLTNAYRFIDLVSSYCFSTHSVSHVRWVLFDLALSNDENLFNLATYELYEYEFNANGDILKKQRPRGYNDSASIVYGAYSRVKGTRNSYQLKVKVVVAGASHKGDDIQFKAKKLSKEGSLVFMIADGIDITPERYRATGIRYNACFE